MNKTTDPTLLRRAIESVGIEKPSDYTLVLEEVERLMDERLVERIARALVRSGTGELDFDQWPDDMQASFRRQAAELLQVSGLSALIRAASDLVQEMEEMGYGKTSDRALPGSFDALIEALSRVQGIQRGA